MMKASTDNQQLSQSLGGGGESQCPSPSPPSIPGDNIDNRGEKKRKKKKKKEEKKNRAQGFHTRFLFCYVRRRGEAEFNVKNTSNWYIFYNTIMSNFKKCRGFPAGVRMG